jgi:hypothetical protein
VNQPHMTNARSVFAMQLYAPSRSATTIWQPYLKGHDMLMFTCLNSAGIMQTPMRLAPKAV